MCVCEPLDSAIPNFKRQERGDVSMESYYTLQRPLRFWNAERRHIEMGTLPFIVRGRGGETSR